MKQITVVLMVALIALGLESCQRREDAELKEMIGQMLMVGFKGENVDPHLAALISDHHIGGVILFDQDVSSGLAPRNIISPEQLTTLVDSMQALAPHRLLISIDQEGGAVQRLRRERGFVGAPSPQYLGEIDNLDSTRFYAARTADELVTLGINVNFVPCVDLNLNPNNPVIGARGRSFSDDTELVVKHSTAIIEEFDKRGIITSIKHFPGHGSSLSDSHLGLTDITNTFSQSELEPYRELIKANMARVVMVGHLFNREIDSLYPASLSKLTIDNLLRGELGYDGVVATDDMNMRAITEHYTYRRALELSINAGVDMVIIGNNGHEFEPNLPERSIAYIYDMVKDGTIPRIRIEQAYERIKQLKRCVK